MSTTPILLAFLAAMVLFGGWVYLAVGGSLRSALEPTKLLVPDARAPEPAPVRPLGA